MPKLNMLPLGMSGVDMLSNPHLLPAKKKLRAAVNLRFEEGSLRTRPGFRYTTLTGPGQFQGACEFQPQRGISSGTFSSVEDGVAVIVSGVLWFRCRERSSELFCGKGPVHIYQAENYLVMQNPNTSTFWWDGTTLTESPGMQEVDFNDSEVPWVEVSNDPLIGEEVDCSAEGGGGVGEDCSTDLTFHVYDKSTQQALQADLLVKINAGTLFDGLIEADGTKFFRDTLVKEHTYTVAFDGYTTVSGSFTPTECEDNHVDVFLQAVSEVDSCLLEASDIVFGDVAEEGWVKLTNVGGSPVTVQDILSSVTLAATSPVIPFDVPVSGYVLLHITAEEPLAGTALTVVTECGTDTEITWPEICEVTGSIDSYFIHPGPVPEIGDTEITITINNTGTSPFNLEEIHDNYFNYVSSDTELPILVLPGGSVTVVLHYEAIEVSETGYQIVTSCKEIAI